MLDRNKLLDVVTGGGDIVELQKRDSCIHLARVALQLTVVSQTLGLSNVTPLDVLNTPSVEFHISILDLLMQVLEEHTYLHVPMYLSIYIGVGTRGEGGEQRGPWPPPNLGHYVYKVC